jgi:biotin-dependent carboxylase-like uncharacterized protein
MSCELSILSCPLPASIQDLGRPGYRHLGVPLCGALDPFWLQLANALVGNPDNAAAVEMRLTGPTLRASADCCFAIAGDADIRLCSDDGEKSLAAWRSHILPAGAQLRIASVRSGVAYLAVAGGIALEQVLGSRSTYARGGMGELLQAGQILPVDAGGTASLRRLPNPPHIDHAPIRLLAGPQRAHFTDAAWSSLLDSDFEISRDADRMGLRLLGPRLDHVSPEAADIVSDAVTPGVIQVPANGQAIVLLADCQTVGGYPKIAVVIAADLRRLGHLLPGHRIRFVEVNQAEAMAARRQAADELARHIACIEPVSDGPDLDALYQNNLIAGVIHAH